MQDLYYNIEKKLDENIKKLNTLKDIIKTLDNKYINKLIHVSVDGDLNLNDIFQEDEKSETDKKEHNTKTEKNESEENNELTGLWLSCGSNWIKWVMLKSNDYCYNDNFLTAENIYEIETKESRGKKILYINTLDELLLFHTEYSYLIDDEGYDIYWDKVSEKYDGLIIDSTLAYKIWEKLNDIKYDDGNINEKKILKKDIDIENDDLNNIYTTHLNNSNIDNGNLSIYSINPMANKNNTYNLKDSILEYAKFYLRWYIKWGTFTGIIWNKKSIKKIKLLKFKIKHK
jgi:hypothetical protein